MSFLLASCQLLMKKARSGSADLDPYQNVTNPQHCQHRVQTCGE
jgi:hypothetical protein